MGQTRFYLELPRDTEVPLGDPFPDGHVVRREKRPEPHLGRLLYEEVGRDHQWTDRLEWSDNQWTYHFMRPQLQLWVLWAVTDPAGYFELRREDDDESVEIAYLGLRPEYTGRGLGRRLLAEAVKQARELGPRVWLHTCTRDHPHALPNYHARGFRIIRTEDM